MPRISKRFSISVSVVAGAMCAVAGCASVPPSPPPPLPEHTRYLWEVTRVATHDEMFGGVQGGASSIGPLPQKLQLQCGRTNADLVDGSFAIARLYYYWHNRASGIVHARMQWVAVPKGLVVESGNVVEVELLAGKSDPAYRCPMVATVRFENLAAGGCEYLSNPRNGLGQVLDLTNPIGGPGSRSIYCPGLEAEGWTLIHVGIPDALAWTKTPSDSDPFQQMPRSAPSADQH